MRVRRIELWIVCSALAVALAAPPRRADAAPNCANMIAQAGGAGVGLAAQIGQLVTVCNQNGWTSTQCIAQGVVVAQAAVWFWWTSSQVYCNCTNNPNQQYCQALGILPAPPNPNGGGGGALPPPGPAPPPPAKPVNANLNDATLSTTAM